MRLDNKLTVDQIAERLDISRTTAYQWIGDLEIPRTKPRPEARRRAAEANRDRAQLKWDVAYKAGTIQFPELVSQPTFRDFICMYIGEGYKKDRNVVSICNSDPAVLTLAERWMSQLTKQPITFALQYHADQDVPALLQFWSEKLPVEPGAIRLQRRSNSNNLTGRTWRSRYGDLTIRAGDTYLRARIQAWMDMVRADWS